VLCLNIEAGLLLVILLLRFEWVLTVESRELLQELAVVFLGARVDIGLRRQQIALLSFNCVSALVLNRLHVNFADAVVRDIFRLQV